MFRHFVPARGLHSLAPLMRLSPMYLPSANRCMRRLCFHSAITCGQTENLTVVFMWSNFEAAFLALNFVTKNKKNPLFSHENSGFLVRVAGFEPTASWTRTKRDTKLRHTRMLPPAHFAPAENQHTLLYWHAARLSSLDRLFALFSRPG